MIVSLNGPIAQSEAVYAEAPARHCSQAFSLS